MEASTLVISSPPFLKIKASLKRNNILRGSIVVKAAVEYAVDGTPRFVLHAFITFIISHPRPQARLQMNLFASVPVASWRRSRPRSNATERGCPQVPFNVFSLKSFVVGKTQMRQGGKKRERVFVARRVGGAGETFARCVVPPTPPLPEVREQKNLTLGQQNRRARSSGISECCFFFPENESELLRGEREKERKGRKMEGKSSEGPTLPQRGESQQCSRSSPDTGGAAELAG